MAFINQTQHWRNQLFESHNVWHSEGSRKKRGESIEKSRRDPNDGPSSRERQEKLAARTKPFPKRIFYSLPTRAITSAHATTMHRPPMSQFTTASVLPSTSSSAMQSNSVTSNQCNPSQVFHLQFLVNLWCTFFSFVLHKPLRALAVKIHKNKVLLFLTLRMIW